MPALVPVILYGGPRNTAVAAGVILLLVAALGIRRRPQRDHAERANCVLRTVDLPIGPTIALRSALATLFSSIQPRTRAAFSLLRIVELCSVLRAEGRAVSSCRIAPFQKRLCSIPNLRAERRLGHHVLGVDPFLFVCEFTRRVHERESEPIT